MPAALQPWRGSRLAQFVAASPLRPKYWRPSLRAAQTLWFNYGHLRSARVYQSLDADGEPVPWYTYPAIEFLKQFDFSDIRVFEYGAGNSTLFWSRRAREVVSVEDEEGWFEQMRSRLPANCTLVHEPDLHRYVDVINHHEGGFDIIVVDGPGRGFTRMKCARAALRHLRPGGLVILDNSDWLPETAAVLREVDLLEVDMSGFAPIAAQTQTTSFFFHRECRLRPRTGRQPLPSVAARELNWDKPRRATEVAPPAGIDIACEDHTFRGVAHDECVTKISPKGPRHFRVLIYRDASGGQQLAVLDLDADRVLVVAHRPRGGGELAAEAARLRDMTWETFSDFVRRHPYRYYVLD